MGDEGLRPAERPQRVAGPEPSLRLARVGYPRGSVSPVADPVAGALAAKKLLEQDAGLRKRIVLYACSLTRNVADAKELAQEAMARAIDPAASPWDPDKERDLFLHIGSLMNSAVANRRRAEQRHPFVRYVAAKDMRVDPAPTAEERMVQEDDVSRLERWMQELRAALAGDDVALGKIDLLYRGIDDAASQAEHLGCTVADIYLANKRIAYHVDRIKSGAGEAAFATVIGPAPPEPPPSEEVGS